MSEDKQSDESAETPAHAVNRRRLLKGAAAAGVGVAAWSAPEIRTLGSTPAYATHTATTAVPTPITDSSTLNATCSDATCANSASWGPTGGTAGQVRIKPPAVVGLAPSDRILVDVTGCTGSVGSAAVKNLTLNGVSLKAKGYCCQVDEIFTSNSGNTVANYVSKGAVGACDPKTFAATAYPGSCGLFLRASIICFPNASGDCCGN